MKKNNKKAFFLNMLQISREKIIKNRNNKKY